MSENDLISICLSDKLDKPFFVCLVPYPDFYIYQIAGAGAWIKGEDYFRMDGSTAAAYRHSWCDIFNDVENIR